MKIVYRLLEQVLNVNSFYDVDRYEVIQGNQETVYFRLKVQKETTQDNKLQDMRYIPAAGSTVEVTLRHIDTNKTVTRIATMAFPSDDRSVWKFDILATDRFAFDSMEVKLTENGVTKRVVGNSFLVSTPASGSDNYC
jgi:hypothetical protein